MLFYVLFFCGWMHGVHVPVLTSSCMQLHGCDCMYGSEFICVMLVHVVLCAIFFYLDARVHVRLLRGSCFQFHSVDCVYGSES